MRRVNQISEKLVRCDFIDAPALCQLQALIAFGNTRASALLWATENRLSVPFFPLSHSTSELSNVCRRAIAKTTPKSTQARSCLIAATETIPSNSKVNAEFYFFRSRATFDKAKSRQYHENNCRGVCQSLRRGVIENSSWPLSASLKLFPRTLESRACL